MTPKAEVNLKPVENGLFNVCCAKCDAIILANVTKRGAAFGSGKALEHFEQEHSN